MSATPRRQQRRIRRTRNPPLLLNPRHRKAPAVLPSRSTTLLLSHPRMPSKTLADIPRHLTNPALPPTHPRIPALTLTRNPHHERLPFRIWAPHAESAFHTFSAVGAVRGAGRARAN